MTRYTPQIQESIARLNAAVAAELGFQNVLTLPQWYRGPQELTAMSAGELFDALTAPLSHSIGGSKEDHVRQLNAAYTVALRIARSGLSWKRWGFDSVSTAAHRLCEIERAGFEPSDPLEADEARAFRGIVEAAGLSLCVGQPSTSDRRWFDGQIEKIAG